jgi:hypothetical protein
VIKRDDQRDAPEARRDARERAAAVAAGVLSEKLGDDLWRWVDLVETAEWWRVAKVIKAAMPPAD